MTTSTPSRLLSRLTERWRSLWRQPARPVAEAHAKSDDSRATTTASGRRPFIRRGLWTTSLQFTDTEAQSRMLTFRPQALLIGYTRSMMGFLRLNPAPQRIAMIGLGGGSLAKYCYRHLRQSLIDVVEINPHVLQLRQTFKVPADDARFRVLLDDGAQFIRLQPEHYDVLLVDGYDASGIAPPLATQRFYHDCRKALRSGGVLVVNLFCDDGDRHLQRIRHAFGDTVIGVSQSAENHCVAFAWREPLPTPLPETLLSAAAQRDLRSELDRIDKALSERRS